MTNSADKRLYLIDAYAMIFRGYYALIRNPRLTSKGLDTSAIFGFTNSLIELIRREKPSHLAVVFDVVIPAAFQFSFIALQVVVDHFLYLIIEGHYQQLIYPVDRIGISF